MGVWRATGLDAESAQSSIRTRREPHARSPLSRRGSLKVCTDSSALADFATGAYAFYLQSVGNPVFPLTVPLLRLLRPRQIPRRRDLVLSTSVFAKTSRSFHSQIRVLAFPLAGQYPNEYRRLWLRDWDSPTRHVRAIGSARRLRCIPRALERRELRELGDHQRIAHAQDRCVGALRPFAQPASQSVTDVSKHAQQRRSLFRRPTFRSMHPDFRTP